MLYAIVLIPFELYVLILKISKYNLNMAEDYYRICNKPNAEVVQFER